MNYKIFSDYLYEFLDYLFGKLDSFSVKITDIEPELITNYIRKSNSEYNIISIKNDGFYEAVQARNNININKIALLTAGNSDVIDSLKDFESYSIIPENYSDFIEIVKKAFSLSLTNEQFDFVKYIYEKKSPNFEIFLTYLEKSLLDCELSDKLLNENLYMLKCWKISSDKIVIDELKAAVRYSNESLIERQIKKAYINNTNFKKIKNYREVISLFSEQNYSEIMKIIYFSDVKEYLSTKNSKIESGKAEEDNDSEQIYLYSYEYFFEHLDEFETIEDLESEIKSEIEKGVDDNKYSDTFRKYQDFINKTNVFDGIIDNLSKANLSENKKQKIMSFLEATKISYMDFANSKTSPMLLLEFCQKGLPFLKKYFETLCLIVSDHAFKRCSNQYKWVESLQNFQFNNDEKFSKIDYGHPIVIYYILAKKYTYDAGINFLKNHQSGSSQYNFAHFLVKSYLDKQKYSWPVEYFLSDKFKYIINEQTDSYPDSFPLKQLNKITSYDSIDFKVITNIIKDYIDKHKLLNEYKIVIIGAPKIKNLQYLFDKINEMSLNKNYLMEKIVISFVCDDESSIKKSITDAYQSGYFSEMIFFKFIQKKDYENDLTIYLDAALLYTEEKLARVSKNKNAILQKIENSTDDVNMEDFFEDNSHLLKVIWDTLQNIEINNDAELSIWENHEISNDILDTISTSIKDNDKSICVLTKNRDLVKDIHTQKNLMDLELIDLNSKDTLKITFSNVIKGMLKTSVPAQINIDFIEFLSQIEYNIPYEFNYKKDKIILNLGFDNDGFTYSYNIVTEENLENEYVVISFIDNIINLAFCGTSIFELAFRKEFVNFLYKNCISINDVVLCYIIDKYCTKRTPLKNIGRNNIVCNKHNENINSEVFDLQTILDTIFNGFDIYDSGEKLNLNLINKLYKESKQFALLYEIFSDKLADFGEELKRRNISHE